MASQISRSPRAPATDGARSTAARALVGRPIVSTLLRLAGPNWVVMVTLAAVSMIDIFFVARLGVDALTGVSMTFPMLMLMQTMAAGGMGGGVASAVARAIGAGQQDSVSDVAAQALVVALGMSALFTAVFLGFGRTLYGAIGASDAALEIAVSYSNVVFLGASVIWVFQLLAAVVRGSGNMGFPAALVITTQLIHAGLCPALIFGVGPLPALGARGAALSTVLSFVPGVAALSIYLASGRGVARLSVRNLRLRPPILRDILRVGLPGSTNNILTNVNVMIVAGLVGTQGSGAVAGFGVASRIEYVIGPLAFGLGTAILTLVGVETGAGDRSRARRIAWIGAVMTAMLVGGIGLVSSACPGWVIHQFSDDASVLAIGALYLRVVGPTYALFGLGIGLWFAAQGAGRVQWPLVGSLSRIVVASAGGWLAVHGFGGGSTSLFAMVAASFVTFGSIIAVAMWSGKVV